MPHTACIVRGNEYHIIVHIHVHVYTFTCMFIGLKYVLLVNKYPLHEKSHI